MTEPKRVREGVMASTPGFQSPVVGNRRIVALILFLLLAISLTLAPPIHHWLLSLFDHAESVIRQREGWGMVIFVLLAALSAMLAFVSSAMLVPVALYVWGPVVCFLLLWTGWFLGGLAGYAIGRYLGRPVVRRLVRPGALARYEGWARSGKSLALILMIQLAVPSDLASYVFGLVRCRFTIFVAALALAEIPYAAGAVYLGASFLERRLVPLVALGLAGVLLSIWALRRLNRGGPPDEPGLPLAKNVAPDPRPGPDGTGDSRPTATEGIGHRVRSGAPRRHGLH